MEYVAGTTAVVNLASRFMSAIHGPRTGSERGTAATSATAAVTPKELDGTCLPPLESDEEVRRRRRLKLKHRRRKDNMERKRRRHSADDTTVKL
jgi:hypothetical protein